MGRGFVALGFVASACSLEPVDLVETRPLALRSTITAADGSMLARLFIENRTLISLDRIPPHVVDAVLAAEDARFFEHPGFDVRAITRAALINASRGEIVQGGSTITQQYVKNVYLTDRSRTFMRKALEVRLAVEVERQLTKREILERYMNTVYFGQGAYGLRSAAHNFFAEPVRRLTLAQGALLAALIKAPATYDPRDHPGRALRRRNYVLDRMSALGRVPPSQALSARAEPLGITPHPPRLRTREPYFVEAVKRELMNDERLGATDKDRAATVWKGGIHVETTLVPRLQKMAEDAVEGVLNRRGDPAAALIAIRPKTGEIVAMIGGRDFKRSQVNLALGKAGGGSGRQPGSAFKGIVAAAAMEAGIGLHTRLDSSTAVFHIDDQTTWTVGGPGSGALRLDEALIDSVNAVYARVAMELGAGAVASQAHLMGVRAHLPIYPSIALGSAEVSVLDMAAAYSTLANGGVAIEPTTIKRIKLATGEVLKPDQERIARAVSPGNAYLLTRVLEQVIERGTGTAADIGRPAAGKTGTTNDYADAWFVGYTPDLVTAVWVGYPQARIPMYSVHGIRVLGGTLPAQIWREFMRRALAGTPPHDFEFPTGELVTVVVDPASGMLAAPWCPPGEKVKVLRELAPKTYCPRPLPVYIPAPQVVQVPAGQGGNGNGSGDGSGAPGSQPEPEPEPEPTGPPPARPSPRPSPT